MDKETIVQLHKEAAYYHKLAALRFEGTGIQSYATAEETWYDVCCWLYARLNEAE